MSADYSDAGAIQTRVSVEERDSARKDSGRGRNGTRQSSLTMKRCLWSGMHRDTLYGRSMTTAIYDQAWAASCRASGARCCLWWLATVVIMATTRDVQSSIFIVQGRQ